MPQWWCPLPRRRGKGTLYSDDPPDVEATDDFVDEMEYEEEEEEVDDDDDIVDDDDDYESEDDFESDDEQDLYVRLTFICSKYDIHQISLSNDRACASTFWRLEMEVLVVEYHLLAHGGTRKRWLWLSRYGSPTIDDIEAYTIAYRAKLDDAESAGRIPQNISLEVSSPGVERVVRVPDELERFKERAMYVRYTTTSDGAATTQEGDGVFRLISYDMYLCECTWGIADVKINRQQAGKGRPLSKKQREWRLQMPFESLKLVRLYSEC